MSDELTNLTDHERRVMRCLPLAIDSRSGAELDIRAMVGRLDAALAAATAERDRLGPLVGAWRSVAEMALRHLVGDWRTSVRESGEWTCPHDAAEALRVRIEALKARAEAAEHDADELELVLAPFALVGANYAQRDDIATDVLTFGNQTLCVGAFQAANELWCERIARHLIQESPAND